MNQASQRAQSLTAEIPYQFTSQDVKKLREEGILPAVVWAEYSRNESKTLQPEHRQLIATEIADRFRAGNTKLPDQLNAIFIQDTLTTRLSKQILNSPADQVKALDVASKPGQETDQALPLWQPPITSLPRYYAASFNLGDGITASSLVRVGEKAYEDQKMLEIIPVSANEAYVRYADNGVAQKMALSDQYAFVNLTNVKETNVFASKQHTHISTVEPGRLVLEGDKWRMIEKIGIRYDGLTIEESIARTTPRLTPESPAKEVSVPTPTAEVTVKPARSAQQPVTQPVVTQTPVEQPVVAQAPATPSVEQARREQSVESVQPTMKPVPSKPDAPEIIQLTPLGDQRGQDELLKERVYEALIPEEYLELRSFLRNDGFLSNDEINAALRDARLEKGDLVQALADKGILSDEPALQEKMADYLWELHEIIQDPSLEKVRADQLYRVQTVQPISGINQATGQEIDPQQRKKGDKSADKSFEIVNGGLIANFLHNYKKAYNLNQNPEVRMEKKTRFQWQDVEVSLGKMGITRELLQESGNLERLLKGEKTSLLDFKSTYNEQETQLRGKVYLVRQGQEIKPYFQTQKLNLIVPDKYLGLQFSEEDKATLKGKGELGRRVELQDAYTKKKFDAYVGVDKETNSLTVWRADRVFIPMQIKGVDVSADQQEMLRQGGSIRLSGLTSENGQKYDADIQLSAGRRSLSFSPPSEAIKQSIDVRVAKDLGRASEQLQGTSAGIATTKDKSPIQQQKKASAKQKGIDPDLAQSADLVPQGKSERANQKDRAKKRKPQQEQGIGM